MGNQLLKGRVTWSIRSREVNEMAVTEEIGPDAFPRSASHGRHLLRPQQQVSQRLREGIQV